jgi:hypothetical protein
MDFKGVEISHFHYLTQIDKTHSSSMFLLHYYSHIMYKTLDVPTTRHHQNTEVLV